MKFIAVPLQWKLNQFDLFYTYSYLKLLQLKNPSAAKSLFLRTVFTFSVPQSTIAQDRQGETNTEKRSIL